MLSWRWLVLIGAVAVSGCAVPLKPFTDPELHQFAADKAARITTDQPDVTGPIDLYEAMARALKFNLDFKVEMMEQALRARELDLTKLDMLPQLVANAGYSARANQSGASSRSLISGRESLEPSTSSERNGITADLELSWDVLDFGLSYVRAKQSADEVLIALERRRKIANRIIEDVRTAYWRAVSSQRLISELAVLEERVEVAFNNSQQLVERRNTSPLTALTYQRELMDIKRELQTLHRELVVAKFQLAALMNLEPKTQFELVVPNRDDANLELKMNSAKLVSEALRNRPELREVAYQMRINAEEAESALLQLLPSFRGFLGWNFDDNDFLFRSNWVAWGARTSWNAVQLFKYPKRKAVIEAQGSLLDQRALALTMAVMTQVHVGRARYAHLRREFATADRSREIQNTIIEQISAQYRAGTVSEQTLIREQMNAIVAEFRRDVAFADLQNAFANIFASIGLDPYDGDLREDQSIADIAENLSGLWRERGDTLRTKVAAPPPPESAAGTATVYPAKDRNLRAPAQPPKWEPVPELAADTARSPSFFIQNSDVAPRPDRPRNQSVAGSSTAAPSTNPTVVADVATPAKPVAPATPAPVPTPVVSPSSTPRQPSQSPPQPASQTIIVMMPASSSRTRDVPQTEVRVGTAPSGPVVLSAQALSEIQALAVRTAAEPALHAARQSSVPYPAGTTEARVGSTGPSASVTPTVPLPPATALPLPDVIAEHKPLPVAPEALPRLAPRGFGRIGVIPVRPEESLSRAPSSTGERVAGE